MIGPAEHIRKIIDQQYEIVKEAHTRITEIWASDILFSFGWLTALLLTVIPWIIWFIFREKESTARLLLGGLWAMLVSSSLDYIGVTMGLWRYYNKVIPLIPDFIPWDFALMPVTIMFFLQIRPSASPFIKGLIFSAMTAFLAEPLFLWLGYYSYPGWNIIYSFPIFFIIYLIAHVLVHSKAMKSL